ncbi:MAG: flagellar basal body rod protein FlgC [Alphaproteobacteria bacterium]|nr:flagellar basal body rod protein FlgC [Alphaproteobacteria bacterium]
MSGDFSDILAISASGLKAQNQRMKIIAENVANANTTASAPGQKPYQRQVITFKKEFDKAIGAYTVKTAGVRTDNSEFAKKYDPTHPAADTQGYVLQPNVNPLIETMDMSEAGRSYQANIDVIAASRTMILKTISLLQ